MEVHDWHYESGPRLLTWKVKRRSIKGRATVIFIAKWTCCETSSHTFVFIPIDMSCSQLCQRRSFFFLQRTIVNVQTNGSYMYQNSSDYEWSALKWTPKAQETLKKRRQKEYRSWMIAKSVMRWCLNEYAIAIVLMNSLQLLLPT